ncbi:glycosyltransferase family 4 protein [Actinomadura macrotermitis]|uniref:D-inositol-3-phosphate glycosyltransferase n=1 Tax=Actinomadura macrotermitis TaxID=2585200 RepID=A0A7K0BR50_9ACTN|nr:glycosyltransferase family 4 protein [Actinomadura macrotermitis]MQY03597.1 D-inositol-3-phosphate glycosyltransferase [Actinomadura macrotermitis]
MTLYFVVPEDMGAPSGGNVYDRRICAALAARGRAVREVAGAGALAALPDGAAVLMDGLVACGVPEIVVPQAARLRAGVLVHLPLADETGLPPDRAADLDARERATLRAVRAVVATSGWGARRLAARHGLERVRVVRPGTDPAPLAPGTDGVSRLLCLGSVTPAKGQDVLVRALAGVADLPWTCELAGPLTRAPDHVARLRALITGCGLDGRVHLTGVRPRACLDTADLLVLPSRVETFGMVVTEALARGVPVLASDVGGVPEALGGAGLLAPPDDVPALSAALRRWLTEPALRTDLRASARARRGTLDGWAEAARQLDAVLEQDLR